MEQKVVHWIMLLLIIWAMPVAAQEPPRPEINLAAYIEQLFPLQDEDLPYEEIYENLLLRLSQPLNLNKASREELQALYLLSPLQIESLLRHIDRTGPLLSLYELQAVPGWDPGLITQVLPFVQVRDAGLKSDNQPLLEQIYETGNRFALLRWERTPERQVGYSPRADSLPPAYVGSADKLYFRLRMHKAHSFSIGLTAEKDAGESLQLRPAENKYGADFYSFHAMLWNRGPFKRIVLGDFQVQYGQGVVLGAGFYLGKGSETITTVGRPSLGLRPYTSVVESGFFRGVGATLGTKKAEVTLYAANTPRDARLRAADSLSSVTTTNFSALQTTGFHRTVNELATRNALRETTAGLAGRWHLAPGTLTMGFTSLYSHFSASQTPGQQLYNRYAFIGKNNWTGSLFAEGQWEQLAYFTEWALSRSGGFGGTAGIMAPLSHRLDMSMLFRHYSREFHSFYGAAFAEGSRLQNESGFYWGLKYRQNKALWLTAYFDRFWFPWLRYRISAPSAGYEYLARFNWQPKKSLLFYAQFREEHKGRDVTGDPKAKVVAETVRRNYLLNLDYQLTERLHMRSRVQWSSFGITNTTSHGYLLLQDLSYALEKWKFSTRYALFQSDDWDNRQYAFERDVLWSFSIPAYYGRGIRYYALLQWKALPKLSIWFRWARTHFRDRSEIGSGTEKISGNTRSSIKLQLKYDF